MGPALRIFESLDVGGARESAFLFRFLGQPLWWWFVFLKS